MDKKKQISMITNAIGWALYADKYEKKPNKHGIETIELSDKKVAKVRKIAEHVYETINSPQYLKEDPLQNYAKWIKERFEQLW